MEKEAEAAYNDYHPQRRFWAKWDTISLIAVPCLKAGYLAIPEMQSKYGRVVNTATNTYVRRSADGSSWGMDGKGNRSFKGPDKQKPWNQCLY